MRPTAQKFYDHHSKWIAKALAQKNAGSVPLVTEAKEFKTVEVKEFPAAIPFVPMAQKDRFSILNKHFTPLEFKGTKRAAEATIEAPATKIIRVEAVSTEATPVASNMSLSLEVDEGDEAHDFEMISSRDKEEKKS